MKLPSKTDTPASGRPEPAPPAEKGAGAPAPPRPRAALRWAAAALLLACAGCVERTIEIRTDPPGRRVFVDGRFAGISPVEVGYTHYGTREISAEDDGAGRTSEILELWPPLYQVFPFDFLTDCLLPFELNHARKVTLGIPPAPAEKGSEAVRKRAELVSAGREFRKRACE